jgi:hypothetical protein
MIIASCGHRIKWSEAQNGAVDLKAMSREAHRAVWTGTLCKKCLKRANREHLVLVTKEEHENWLNGTTPGHRIW